MSSSANSGLPGTQPIGAPETSGQPFNVEGPFNSAQPGAASLDGQAVPTTVPEVAAPTWRDLPYEPPYGPVPPPRTPNIHDQETQVVVEDEPSISAKQIALAIGGLLLLIGLGIGGALFLLDDDTPAVAQNDPPPALEDPTADLPTPDVLQPAPQPTPQPPASDSPAPNQGQGELAPSQPTPDAENPPVGPSDEDPAADPNAEEGDQTPPEPDDQTVPEQAPGQDPPAEQDQPDAIPAPDTPPQDQPDIELPRLFELRRLPAGTGEGSTTVRQTSGDDRESVTEQTTILDTDAGEEYSITATRAEDAAERYDRLVEDARREIAVSGQGAVITENGDLAYLVDGEVDTLIVIDGPASAGADALVVVAQGLELLQ